MDLERIRFFIDTHTYEDSTQITCTCACYSGHLCIWYEQYACVLVYLLQRMREMKVLVKRALKWND